MRPKGPRLTGTGAQTDDTAVAAPHSDRLGETAMRPRGIGRVSAGDEAGEAELAFATQRGAARVFGRLDTLAGHLNEQDAQSAVFELEVGDGVPDPTTDPTLVARCE